VLGIVFTGAEGPDPEKLKILARKADLLAAADSGLITAELAGLKVDWIVGDMDSLDDTKRLDNYSPEKIRRFSRDKDLTDTELALALLREKGCDEIWIAGGGGGRLDHLFAVRSLFERDDPPLRWYTASEEVRCIMEGTLLKIDLPGESLVSVFPLGMGPWEADSYGLKWPLIGLPWAKGSFGLSNIAYGHFEIRSIRGRFMVIIPMDNEKVTSWQQ
jgi:thiamine pyrophosphokinase